MMESGNDGTWSPDGAATAVSVLVAAGVAPELAAGAFMKPSDWREPDHARDRFALGSRQPRDGAIAGAALAPVPRLSRALARRSWQLLR